MSTDHETSVLQTGRRGDNNAKVILMAFLSLCLMTLFLMGVVAVLTMLPELVGTMSGFLFGN